MGGNPVQILLSGRRSEGRYVLVDAADAPFVMRWHWHLIGGRYAARSVRVGGRAGGWRMVYMHRLLLDPAADREVDHINRDGLDNRRVNLREVTHAENHQNVPAVAGRTSPYRGVFKLKNKERWGAVVSRDNGNAPFYRTYPTEEAANSAVRAARARLMPFATE